ncbi:MAG: DUF5615 family PIN-like protein [Desulfamplus sp.]|nr:DUF5615 family PIN-like protein [Desulfamplus sp.]
MNGYLFDENLPKNIEISTTYAIIHVTDLGNSLTDSQIWEYSKQNNLVIVTKDTDFSDRIIISISPPKVIHLRFGNMKMRDFHAFLQRIWPQVESLIQNHRLVNIYLNQFECIE